MQNLNNGKIVPTLATVSDKNVHAAFKKPIASVFTMTTAVKFEPYVDETILYMVRRLDEDYIQGSGKGQPCDVDNWLQYCACLELESVESWYSQQHPSRLCRYRRTRFWSIFWILENWQRWIR